jgi:adenylate cyclase
MPAAAKKRPRARKVLAALAISAAAAALSAALWLPGILDGLEGWSFDLRARALAEPGKANPDIVVIRLDQQSLDWAEKENSLYWPWYREVYGKIMGFCASGGAKAFVMDVIFSGPSVYGPEDDLALAEAARASGILVSTIQLLSSDSGQSSLPAYLRDRLPAFLGAEAWLAAKGRIDAKRSVVPNIPAYGQAAAATGNVIYDPDPDGVIRRIPPLHAFDGTAFPSIGLAAYLEGEGIGQIGYASGDLSAGNALIPLDGKGRAILRYRGPTQTYTSYNAAEILQCAVQIEEGKPPKYDPSVFKGKYVFFGFTAPGLMDLRSTPMGKIYPGVEINATFADNLLSGGFIRDTPESLGILIILAACFLASLLMMNLKRATAQGICFSVFLVLPVGLGFGLYALGIWFPMMPSLLSLILCLSASALYNYSTEGRQKAFIKSAFRQYLSPIVIEQLIANPEKLNLGGERRMLSIYFSDVQGFTSLSEALSPEELTSVLNEYLSAMTDIIQEEGGTVDKYEGDAIIAFWNAPLDLPDHGLRAVTASLRCQEKLAEMRPGLKARTGKDLFMRIGLNSGPAVVGNMGSKTRFDYTMLGDAVNLAARLEGVNKQFGTYTMISENTLKEIKDAFAVRELSRIAVVGKKIPVRVYEPMSHELYAQRKDVLEAFAEALALYYRGDFRAARDAFSVLSDRDPPAAKYFAQCERLIASPPSEWEGVWTMTEK